jgi:hypothetical protein
MMPRTMSPEMDAWLASYCARHPVAVESGGICDSPGPAPAIPRPVPKSEPVPPCPLNEIEFAWLWDRYVRCSFPPASAPKRLAKTPLANLSTRGRNFAVRMAYKFRRQIFGKAAAKLGEAEFLAECRRAAASAVAASEAQPAATPVSV